MQNHVPVSKQCFLKKSVSPFILYTSLIKIFPQAESYWVIWTGGEVKGTRYGWIVQNEIKAWNTTKKREFWWLSNTWDRNTMTAAFPAITAGLFCILFHIFLQVVWIITSSIVLAESLMLHQLYFLPIFITSTIFFPSLRSGNTFGREVLQRLYLLHQSMGTLLFTKFFKKILPSWTTGLIPRTLSYTSP